MMHIRQFVTQSMGLLQKWLSGSISGSDLPKIECSRFYSPSLDFDVIDKQPITRSIGMQRSSHSPVIATTQSGAVLVISLIFLLLLSLVGVTGSQMTSMEEKMSGNSKNHNLAFQAAESALLAGEAATATLLPALCYPYTKNQPQDIPGIVANINWSDNNDTKIQTYNGGSLKDVKQPPRYVIFCNIPGQGKKSGPGEVGVSKSSSSSKWYLITARGYGGTANSVVTLQSVYQRK
jgi:type IV pilus assembly protein PilX